MRKIFLLVLVLSAIELYATLEVNSVIGDNGWMTVFGEVAIGEKDKISAHLFYAEDFLRQHASSGWNEEQLHNRQKMLDALRDYRQREEFPQNENYPGERRPHFIDS